MMCNVITPHKTQANGVCNSPNACPIGDPFCTRDGSGTRSKNVNDQPRTEALAQPISGKAISNKYSRACVARAHFCNSGETVCKGGGEGLIQCQTNRTKTSNMINAPIETCQLINPTGSVPRCTPGINQPTAY